MKQAIWLLLGVGALIYAGSKIKENITQQLANEQAKLKQVA